MFGWGSKSRGLGGVRLSPIPEMGYTQLARSEVKWFGLHLVKEAALNCGPLLLQGVEGRSGYRQYALCDGNGEGATSVGAGKDVLNGGCWRPPVGGGDCDGPPSGREALEAEGGLELICGGEGGSPTLVPHASIRKSPRLAGTNRGGALARATARKSRLREGLCEDPNYPREEYCCICRLLGPM